MNYIAFLKQLITTNLFDWKGRSGRLQFLVQKLFIMLCMGFVMSPVFYRAWFVTGYQDMPLVDIMQQLPQMVVGGMMVGTIAVFIMDTLLYFRRLHDFNMSGLWVVAVWLVAMNFGVMAAASAGVVAILYNMLSYLPDVFLVIKQGDKKDNRFGSPVTIARKEG